MKTTIQIFLSYARDDEEEVKKLYQKLSDAGFKPWMDKKDLLPGERWKSCIQKAIQDSDFFLACLSANSVTKRGFLQREINNALDMWREKLDDDIFLIPARLEDCEVPERLRDFQWVDMFEEDGWTRLIKAIQTGLDRRETVIKPLDQEVAPHTEGYGLSPAVLLFFNLVVLIALTFFFEREFSSQCVPTVVVGFSAAIVTLELFHLTWRYLGNTLSNLVISIGSIKIPLGQLAALFELLHPRAVNVYVLWAQAFIFLTISGVLWSPALSPFSSDQVPDIQYFLVHHADGHIERYAPGSLLPIEKDTMVLVEVQTSTRPGISCAWSTTAGTLLPARGCATRYSTSMEENRDTLAVVVKSPCRVYQAFAGLHIEILQ